MDMVDKIGATDVAFTELEGLINKSQLAAQYFNKRDAWLSQKLHGCTVLNCRKAFSEAEYHQLAGKRSKLLEEVSQTMITFAAINSNPELWQQRILDLWVKMEADNVAICLAMINFENLKTP